MFGLMTKKDFDKQLRILRGEFLNRENHTDKRIAALIEKDFIDGKKIESALSEKKIEKVIEKVLSDMLMAKSSQYSYYDCFNAFINMINTRIDEHAHKFLTNVVNNIINPESFIDDVVERINKKKVL